MTPNFKIRTRTSSSLASHSLNERLTEEVLKEIIEKITGQIEYTVESLDERDEGRYIILETINKDYIISISKYGNVESRNSYMQSVATAYTDFLNYTTNKDKEFCYYSLYFEGNNKTGLIKFYYKLMKTIGCRFLNEDYIMGGNIINTPFTNVKDIIETRNNLRGRNSANKSSYITEEGDFYHFYGKTFGANSKETVLMCYALSAITDKKIRLFQITDNNSRSLGREDLNSLQSTEKIDVIGEGSDFDENTNSIREKDPNDIRDQAKFNYNLLARLGNKRCSICDCQIDGLIQAAHVWPIAAIKSQESMSLEDKKYHAINEHNGIWLCQNHHKLFDLHIIKFDNNEVVIDEGLEIENKNFVELITTKYNIPQNIITNEFNRYLAKRYS